MPLPARVMTALARGMLALAAALASLGCNPFDDVLPASRCRQAAMDCRPGERCRGGLCRAEHELVIDAAAGHDGAWHAAVLATPRASREPLRDPDARLLGIAHAEPSEHVRLRLSELPSLSATLALWRGAAAGPCPGDPVAIHPVSAQLSRPLRLVLHERWTDGCLSLPRELRSRDRFLFRGARFAERGRATRD